LLKPSASTVDRDSSMNKHGPVGPGRRTSTPAGGPGGDVAFDKGPWPSAHGNARDEDELSTGSRIFAERELAGLGNHEAPTRYCAELTEALVAEEASMARARNGDGEPPTVYPIESEPAAHEEIAEHLPPQGYPSPAAARPRRVRTLLLVAALATAGLAIDTYRPTLDIAPAPPAAVEPPAPSVPAVQAQAHPVARPVEPAPPPQQAEPPATDPPPTAPPTVWVGKGRLPSMLEVVKPPDPSLKRRSRAEDRAAAKRRRSSRPARIAPRPTQSQSDLDDPF
jgi:hypothetical protein